MAKKQITAKATLSPHWNIVLLIFSIVTLILISSFNIINYYAPSQLSVDEWTALSYLFFSGIAISSCFTGVLSIILGIKHNVLAFKALILIAGGISLVIFLLHLICLFSSIDSIAWNAIYHGFYCSTQGYYEFLIPIILCALVVGVSIASVVYNHKKNAKKS